MKLIPTHHPINLKSKSRRVKSIYIATLHPSPLNWYFLPHSFNKLKDEAHLGMNFYVFYAREKQAIKNVKDKGATVNS